MGSGSSKSRKRAIMVCSNEPLDPTELSRGNHITEGRDICEQMERGKGKEMSAQSNMSTVETEGRRSPTDPDLQLLDDVLAESEDCLPWQESTCKGQRMRNSPPANSKPILLPQGHTKQNQTQDAGVERILQTTAELEVLSPECDNTTSRQETMSDNSNTTAQITKSVLDTENNNLPTSTHTCTSDTEAPAPIMYDDTEEALMDSIEQEFLKLQPVPMCSLKI